MFTGKTVLILDLDETLIHSSDSILQGSFDSVQLKSGKYLYMRPHLSSFLLAARNRFKYLILWSNGSYDYVHEVIQILEQRIARDLFDMIYTLNDASWMSHKGESFPFKDLYALIDNSEFEEQDCIMVDDSILIASFYPHIIHQIPKFNAGVENIYDRQLSDLRSMMVN